MNATMSASCSMAPDSRRSESCGRFDPPRISVARLSCDRAITGTFSSLAMALSVREMKATSCSRFPFESWLPVISCR